MKSLFTKFQRGQGMTEYILIIGLVAVAAVGVYQLFGQTVRSQTGVTASALGGENSPGTSGLGGAAGASASQIYGPSGGATGGSAGGAGGGAGGAGGRSGGAGGDGEFGSAGGADGGSGIFGKRGGFFGGSGGGADADRAVAQSAMGDENVGAASIEDKIAHQKRQERSSMNNFLIFIIIAVALVFMVYMILVNRARRAQANAEADDLGYEPMEGGDFAGDDAPKVNIPASSGGGNGGLVLDRASMRRNKVSH